MNESELKTKTRQSALAHRSRRGQAAVEYSMVTHFMFFAGALTMFPIVMRLMEAITTFYDSVYAVIQTGAV
jgi:hypothetical protein